ncbi:pilus assembly protein PilW [Herminiimonas sp. KBW02]|nr:pilus assembly protein PilW [Herminiimonas sp. KBW02]
MTELMVAMTIGLFITLLATGLLASNQAAYLAQDQYAQVQETGRYAMEMLARAIRQAGYKKLDAASSTTDIHPHVIGMDASSLKRTTAGLDAAASSTVVNGSDVLALSYASDEAMFNCAGMTVTSVDKDEDAWSMFFVGRDRTGEPELRCKYRSRRGWNADAIARGIESFQVLYGLDADDNGVVDRYINASDVEAMDDVIPLNGENAIAWLADRQQRTHWKKVRAVKVSILVRSAQAARDEDAKMAYHLFDAAYQNADDIGVHINEQDMPVSERKRIRKVFTQTIQLRNGGAADGI